MVFREGEDVVGGDVSHGLGVGGRGPEEADHLLHLWRWQRGGCHGPWQERGADLPGIVSHSFDHDADADVEDNNNDDNDENYDDIEDSLTVTALARV